MIRIAMIAAAASAALLGCGGGGGSSAACKNFSACGGDPVGTWMFVDQCIEGDPTGGICPEATLDSSDFSISGTLTVNDDGTYTSETTTSGTSRGTIPASCLEGLPIESCDDLDDPEAGQDCSGDIENACDCESDVSGMEMANGTWSTNGEMLVIDEGTADEQSGEFCVDGNSFTFQIMEGDVVLTTVLER